MYTRPLNGGIAIWNGGGDVSGVGGYFGLDGKHAGILLGMLPPIVHIRKEADKLALRWSIERMMQELREPQPGSFLVLQHLAQLMLVQALRAHLADGLSGSVGWLFALADQQMSAAIHAMHDDPAHPWTLQELAEKVGMSRSGFAAKFKETVGSTPIDYLIRWRMLLAGDRLKNSGDPISVISLSLGYESESAFSTAFKSCHGLFAAAIQPWPGLGCLRIRGVRFTKRMRAPSDAASGEEKGTVSNFSRPPQIAGNRPIFLPSPCHVLNAFPSIPHPPPTLPGRSGVVLSSRRTS